MVGGRAILVLDPGALGRLARHRRVVLVSGTNGKTTTTSLLAAALTTAGPVVTNLLGANLPPGLAAALAAAADTARTAVLEVDEAWLGRVADEVAPAVAVLLNLSRDQLDRNNEVRHLSATWRAVLARSPAVHVVANADDPLVAWAALAACIGHLGRRRPAVDGGRRRLSQLRWPDPLRCRWRHLRLGLRQPAAWRGRPSTPGSRIRPSSPGTGADCPSNCACRGGATRPTRSWPWSRPVVSACPARPPWPPWRKPARWPGVTARSSPAPPGPGSSSPRIRPAGSRCSIFSPRRRRPW